MSNYSPIFTANNTTQWVWVTIQDLGRTSNLDYGWVKPGTVRQWNSGNYGWGSFYYVRAEVKDVSLNQRDTDPDWDPEPNLFDTSVQINPQSPDTIRAVFYDVALALADKHGDGAYVDQQEGTGNSVTIQGSDGNYWWSFN